MGWTWFCITDGRGLLNKPGFGKADLEQSLVMTERFVENACIYTLAIAFDYQQDLADFYHAWGHLGGVISICAYLALTDTYGEKWELKVRPIGYRDPILMSPL